VSFQRDGEPCDLPLVVVGVLTHKGEVITDPTQSMGDCQWRQGVYRPPAAAEPACGAARPRGIGCWA
jgi:hypothetical protein